ncbi:invasion associated locus B family protein [uncultured Paracoccus sp.]|uniref:invasion associated locus B family protein n=1 Tax=uncultured Paracoccus sp. TaxID=189685 RepID=UPI0026224884|nr:invasion associated locus B family protein [uncultured Paracoccus sp.]
MAHRMSAALAAVLLAGVPAGMALAQTSSDSAAAAPATQTDTAPAAPAATTGAAPGDTGSPAGQSTTDTAPAADTSGTTSTADTTGPAPSDGATDGAATATTEPAAQAAESGDGSTSTPAPDAAGQSATETTPPAAAGQADAPAAPADPGQPADATQSTTAQTDGAPAGEPRPGTYYTQSTHGDWTLRCMKAAEGQDPCELYQLMKDDQGSAVAEVSVIPFTGEAAAILNFVAPLETDLGAGLGLQIDAGQAAKYPFMVCAPIGCISRIGMTSDELAAFKRGNAATVTLLPFGGNPDQNTVRLSLSLTGFTAGFDALAAQPAPGPAPSQ